MAVIVSILIALRSLVRSRAELHLEILALRHQLQVLERSRRSRVRLTVADRLLWLGLSRIWTKWRPALVLVQPATVVAWHRRGFRLFWTWKSRHGTGRPTVPVAVRELIRTMSHANPLWGAPRIHGELLKLGIAVSQSTVAKYIVSRRRPPSQTWRTFLANHVDQLMAADFFVVPTATYRLLFVLVILAHERRRVVHVAVTDRPTSAWTAQQLRNAFPKRRVPVLPAARSRYRVRRNRRHHRSHADPGRGDRPPFAMAECILERFIGSVRRECLDHVLVFNESGLRRVLRAYRRLVRTITKHLALAKDTPIPRPIMGDGVVVAIPEIGGLHHHYERRTA